MTAPLFPSSPPQRRQHASASARLGFSLTELLVVIGIIVLLVSLLLVALGQVRSKAKAIQTQTVMNGFSQACSSYQMEHGEYPGVIPERLLAEFPQTITTTENAILALMGGYRLLTPQEEGTQAEQEYNEFTGPSVVEYVFGDWKLAVDPNRIGEGPTIDSKPFPPYFTPSGGELGVVNGQKFETDDFEDELPDLLDDWGQPILMVRRIRPVGELVGDVLRDTPQFTTAGLGGYILAEPVGETIPGLGRLGVDQVRRSSFNVNKGIDDDAAYQLLAKVLEHPALEGEPRGDFMLLSAGEDGAYLDVRDGPGTESAAIDDMNITDLIFDAPPTIIDDFDDIRVFGGG